jgi:hypothetical protein
LGFARPVAGTVPPGIRGKTLGALQSLYKDSTIGIKVESRTCTGIRVQSV